MLLGQVGGREYALGRSGRKLGPDGETTPNYASFSILPALNVTGGIVDRELWHGHIHPALLCAQLLGREDWERVVRVVRCSSALASVSLDPPSSLINLCLFNK